MKLKVTVILFAVLCYAECRKVVPPINKNDNIAFINMEAGGGGVRPNVAKQAQTPNANKPVAPAPAPVAPAPAPVKPASPPSSPPASPVAVPPQKPVGQTVNSPVGKTVNGPVGKTEPISPPKPAQPSQPTQIKPKPVNPAPVANPITTPGPGSVKQLVQFYDSQGKASPIRPYSYSQAVKQG